MEASQEWRDRALAETAGAFRSATSVADRLALLRSWTRLADGRLHQSELPSPLTAAERADLSRFGLAAEGPTLRLRVSELDEIAPGLEAASRLDTSLRRAFRPADPDGMLRRWSAYESYQSETQKAAVRAVMTAPPGASLCVSMPTGSGKSLLFQLAARAWRATAPGACALVITPLVGLAQDHQRTLSELPGLESCRALHGGMSAGDIEATLFDFRNGLIPLLLTSPEIAFGRARSALMEAAKPPEAKFGLAARLAAVFIDEVHIIESWGRRFRPDFQRLPGLVRALRAQNPDLPTVLLSATISPAARQLLRQAYGDQVWLEVHAGTPRYDFDIVTRGFEDPHARDAALLRAIDLLPRPAIVYTTRVEAAETLFEVLRGRGYSRIALFTGDTESAAREDVIARWAKGDLDLVVGTSAFGLGINKVNVRTVLHACLPEGAARWYQEIGRAGRDGRQGLAVALWTEDNGRPRTEDDAERSDVDQALGMSGSDWLTRPIAEDHWAALLARATVTWEGAQRILTVPLDAAPPRLGPHTGSHNRRWNQSLLNLLQRAGAIRVMAVDETTKPPTWRFELIAESLLGDAETADAAWREIYVLRDAEQQRAIRDARKFVELMRGARAQCLLVGAYSLIEPELWSAPPCGRCPTCRAEQRLPPDNVRSGGPDAVWPDGAAPARGLTGAILVRPDDPSHTAGFAQLIERLARAGVEQVIVPDGRAGEAATLLAASPARLGLVLSHADWLDGGWALANLPTAAILDEHAIGAETWLRRGEAFLARYPGQRLILIADPTRRVGGRRLDQTASPLAAYNEAFLDTLDAPANEVVA